MRRLFLFSCGMCFCIAMAGPAEHASDRSGVADGEAGAKLGTALYNSLQKSTDTRIVYPKSGEERMRDVARDAGAATAKKFTGNSNKSSSDKKTDKK